MADTTPENGPQYTGGLQGEIEQLEHKIEILRERLDLALSAGKLAWWEMHVPSGMVTFNINKILMLGYSRDEFDNTVHYKRFMEMVHPDDYESTMNAMKYHILGLKEIYETEYRIKTKNGDYKWFYDRGSITDYDENRQPLLVKGIVFDNTARKEAELALKKSEAELRQANLAKDRFFSIIAHDLKSPFNSLMGLADMLYERYHKFDDAKKLELIDKIKNTSESTFELLNDLLDWSRAESNNIRINFEELNVHKLVQDVLHLMLTNVNYKNIHLLNHVEENVTIFADVNLTETVFRNVISNAIKFTPVGGHITVESKEKTGYVEICISDDGIGIPLDKLNNLFHIENKYHTQGTEKETGTGLGLIVTKEFMEKNKGRIRIESKENIGTAIYLTFQKPST